MSDQSHTPGGDPPTNLEPASEVLAGRIREAAFSAGFDAVGVARLADLQGTPDGDRYVAWLREGRHGAMGYLERGRQGRVSPESVLPGARSVVCVALNHGDPPTLDAGHGGPLAEPSVGQSAGPSAGTVARYARGRDYHKVFTRRLRNLEEALAVFLPGAATRRYVDTGPVLEKFWAERAGLGWRGKHTNLVSREFGSWLLLGEILLDCDLPTDLPEGDHCGTCVRCLDACPTGAITAPYQLDARLCISYLTIELRGSIPVELREAVGDRIFGCDDCLAVCPWNRFAKEAREADFRPRPGLVAPLLEELVALDEAGFLARFAGTPVIRAKREGLARNACVALGNTRDPAVAPSLIRALAEDVSPVVREHAAWALGRIGGPGAREALRRARNDVDSVVSRAVLEALDEEHAGDTRNVD